MSEDDGQRTEPVERMFEFDRFEAEDDGWRAINGNDLEGDESPEVGPWLIEELLAGEVCPYCNRGLRRAGHNWGDAPQGGNCREWTLVHCPNCAFWQFFGKHGLLNDFPSRIYWEAYIGKARTFANSLPPGCERELAQALRRNRSHWTLLDPSRLETFVAEILRANHQPCQVTHLGRPFDGGIDVLLIDSAQHEWVVQVKRRTSHSGEGVDTVRNLLGVMYADDKLRGIVVSTADHFTYRAYDLRQKAAKKGCMIELVDRGKLDLMFSPLIPQRPWIKLREYDQDLFRLLERKLQPRRKLVPHGDHP